MSQIKSTQNDFTGEILDFMESMHEVNESLGLIDGDGDLMAKMSLEEKVDAIQRRLMLQNKMNETVANFMQSDTMSITFSVFGNKMQEFGSQLAKRTMEHENLKNEVVILRNTVEKNHEYTKSLERTIMKMLTGKSGDEEEDLRNNKEATIGNTPLGMRFHGGGLIGRVKNVEDYVDNELFPTLEGFKEFDERTKDNLDTLRYEMDETTEVLEREFSEENKAKLEEAIANGGGGNELKKNLSTIKELWEGFNNDVIYGLRDLFQRSTKDMTHLIKKKKKPTSAGGESEESLKKDVTSEQLIGEEDVEEVDHENIFFSEEFQEQFNEKDYQFVVMLVKLRDNLSDIVGTFEPRETDDETLEAVHPQLVSLHTQVSYLLEHDQQTKDLSCPNLCLDDLICEDRKYDLRHRLVTAIDACDYTLSKGVSAYKMLLRVDELDKHTEVKRVQSKMDMIEKEINEILEDKADKASTLSALDKKTNKNEMLQLKDVLYRRMDDIQATFNSFSGPGRTVSVGGGNGNGSAGGDQTFLQSELSSINERFELLYRQFQDLSLGSQLLVPRTEVEEAMKGVLLEIKRVRGTTLDKKAIDKLIEKKTDQVEFEKMINALTGSLEGLREYVDAMNGNAQKLPSAFKHKCLVCDKLTDPASALAELEQTARQLTASKNKRDKHDGVIAQAGYPQRPYTTHSGYHKSEDPTTRSPPQSPKINLSNINNMEDLSTMNHDPLTAYEANISIYQDNSFKRNVVDLRPITSPTSSTKAIKDSPSMAAVQFVEVSGGNNYVNSNQMSRSLPEASLQRRIKSTAGGGMGSISKNIDNRR